MRAFVWSAVFAATLFSPAVAWGQQQVPIWLSTSFDGPATEPYDEGDLTANWDGDGWARTGDGGVSPTTDDMRGGFGEPVDSFENFLLAGDGSWQDVVVETVVRSNDDDPVGIVARYSGPGSYYACMMSRDGWPACNGRARRVSPMLGLVRVDTERECVDDYLGASVESRRVLRPGQAYRMHLEAIGGRVVCAVDIDGDGDFDGDRDLVIGGEDPEPLPGGKAGLVALDSDDTDFLSFIVGGLDPQDDPVQDPIEEGEELEDPGPAPTPDNDGDGLPDFVEGLLGSDPNNPDSDGDGVPDGVEPEAEADTDGDGLLNLLDPDSDNDGRTDGEEDTNLNGIVDEGETDPLVADEPLDEEQPEPEQPEQPDEPANPEQPEPAVQPEPGPQPQPQDDPQPTPQADPQPQPQPQPQADPQPQPEAAPAPAAAPRRLPEEVQPEGELFVAGGGCAQGGGSTDGSWLVALMFLGAFVLRRLSSAPLLAVLLIPAVADALPAERFRMASAGGLMDVETGGVAPGTAFTAGLWLGKSANSMVLMRRTDAGTVDRVGALVGDRMAGVVSLGAAVAGRASVELRAPLLLSQTRDDVDAIGVNGGLEASGMGDLKLSPKLRLLDADEFGVDLAVLTAVTLPTGDAAAFMGEEGLTLSPEVAVSRRHGAFRWGVNTGARLRKEQRIGDQNLGSELVTRAGAGLGWTMASRRFELAATASYAAPASSSELFAGLSAELFDGLQAFAGAGAGVMPGQGAPDQRIAFGMRYTHRPGAAEASAAPPAPRTPPPAAYAEPEEDVLMDDPLEDLFPSDEPTPSAPESDDPAPIEFAPDDLTSL